MTSESSDPKVTPPAETAATRIVPVSRPGSADQLSGDPLSGNPLSDGKDASLRSKRLWSTAELMGGESEILIEHNGSIYRLRRTRQGKLILSK